MLGYGHYQHTTPASHGPDEDHTQTRHACRQHTLGKPVSLFFHAKLKRSGKAHCCNLSGSQVTPIKHTDSKELPEGLLLAPA